MVKPSMTTIAAAATGGLVNVIVLIALFARGGYPTLESTTGAVTIIFTGFVLGFVALLVTAHTRLVLPATGFLGVLLGTTYVEVTSAMPQWSELNGYSIVDGPTHVLSYASTWYVWLAILLLAGVFEFGIRRGYSIGDQRLRNLPDIPLSRYTITWVVTGFAGLIGVATMLLVIRAGVRPSAVSLVVFVVAVAVAAVPLAALLLHGILLPMLLFAVFVPYILGVEVFLTTESPVHILFFGPYAILLALAWGVEALIRKRIIGWNNGQFTAADPE